MKVSQIYIYPVKSLRGVSVGSAVATRTGFRYDRQFCLVQPDADGTLQHISIGRVDELCLFHVELLPSISSPTSVRVTYRPPKDDNSEPSFLEFSLTPDYEGLDKANLNMHKSPCTAYDMGDIYADFFSKHLRKSTRLIYIGDASRKVLGNVAPNERSSKNAAAPSLLSSWLPKIMAGSTKVSKEYTISFADVAAFLVTTTTSLQEVGVPPTTGSAKDSGELDLDMTKLRPNIVLTPNKSDESQAFEEDYWAEILLGETRIVLTANCARCKSLNVDYDTGKQLPIEKQMLKRLAAKGRRVDPGMKYSPIFGRYGFVADENIDDELTVGCEVKVLRKNEDRTVFHWPGISTDQK